MYSWLKNAKNILSKGNIDGSRTQPPKGTARKGQAGSQTGASTGVHFWNQARIYLFIYFGHSWASNCWFDQRQRTWSQAWRKRQISHHKENKLAWHALRTLTENIGGVQFSTRIFTHQTSAGPPSCLAAFFKIAHCLVTRPREPSKRETVFSPT